MKLDVKKVKSAGIQTGMAVAGFVGGHVASQFAPAKVQKFVPYGEIALGVGLAAISKSDAVSAFGVGLAAHGAVKTVNNLTSSADGSPATGIKGMISNYMPSLNGYDSMGIGMGYANYPQYEEAPLLMGVDEYAPAQSEWM